MARPNKIGLDYFPFDIDFFEDEKIMAISGEFGIKGEITAIKLLCAIYRNGYFILWNDLFKYKLLKSLSGVSAELLDSIVTRLVVWGFFDQSLFDSTRVLTSKGIQRRYFEASKRRKNEGKWEHLLINVSYCGVNANINPSLGEVNANINPIKKSKEKNIPPQTPPNGGVSSESGGGGIASPLSQEKLFDVKTALRGKPGVSEGDVWEAMRLTENGKETSPGTPFVKQWAANPSMCHFYEVIQRLQQLERTGQIRVMPHADYFVYVFLLCQLTKSDADTVRCYIKHPVLFEECKRLIEEIKKGGINQPGRFLIKKLRDCQKSMNKQNLKL